MDLTINLFLPLHVALWTVDPMAIEVAKTYFVFTRTCLHFGPTLLAYSTKPLDSDSLK